MVRDITTFKRQAATVVPGEFECRVVFSHPGTRPNGGYAKLIVRSRRYTWGPEPRLDQLSQV